MRSVLRGGVVVVLLTVLLFPLSCKKDEPVIVEDDVNQIEQSEFPLMVGNWWKYKVTDFYAGTTDTLTVKVIGVEDSSVNTKRFSCLLFMKGLVVDSSEIVISENEISYKGLNPYYSYFGNYKLVFPIALNDEWVGFNNPDTIRVVGVSENVEIEGTLYAQIYSLKRSFFLVGGYNLNQLLLISPKVGIVNQSIDLFTGASAQKQTFSLIEYSLN